MLETESSKIVKFCKMVHEIMLSLKIWTIYELAIVLKKRGGGEYNHAYYDKRANDQPNSVNDFFVSFMKKHICLFVEYSC